MIVRNWRQCHINRILLHVVAINEMDKQWQNYLYLYPNTIFKLMCICRANPLWTDFSNFCSLNRMPPDRTLGSQASFVLKRIVPKNGLHCVFSENTSYKFVAIGLFSVWKELYPLIIYAMHFVPLWLYCIFRAKESSYVFLIRRR